MHIEAQIVRELIKAGLSGDALLAAIDRLESAEILRISAERPPVDEQAERRRAADRERKKNDRLKTSAETSAERDIDNNTPLSEDNNNIPLCGNSADAAKPKAYDAPFEDLWQHFSRKVGKDDAHRAWQKVRRRVSHADLVAAVKAQARLDAGKEKRFIAHPATWLNDGRWQDEDLQPPKPLPESASSRVYVKYGTDAGDAWEAHYRAMGKVPPRDQHGGWWFDSESPPEIVQHETSDAATVQPATSEAA